MVLALSLNIKLYNLAPYKVLCVATANVSFADRPIAKVLAVMIMRYAVRTWGL